MNAYHLVGAIPTSVLQGVISQLSMAQQQFFIVLVSGSAKVALQATPTGLDGSMLLFYNSLVQNSALLQATTLLLGALLLLGISIYAAYRLPVKRPSILAMVKEEGRPTFMRGVWLFLLLIAFFVMVFNLLFEWFALAIDAPLLLVTILVVGFLYITRRSWLCGGSALEQIERSSDDFFTKSFSMLRNAKTVLLIICGMLILHLVTDIGNYILPVLTGVPSFYAYSAGGSPTLYSMIQSSLVDSSLQNAGIIAAYLLSASGIFFLLSLPGLIWYKLYKLRSTGSHEHLPDWRGWQIGVVMASISVSLLLPIFSIASLRSKGIVGVLLVANPITAERALAIPSALSIALGIFLLCVLISMLNDWARRAFMIVPFGVAIIFFGFYIYNYFTSTFLYYAQVLVELFTAGDALLYAILPVMFLLFAITIIFYITGFVSFIYEIWRD
jgi:hypothetical protein